MEKAKVAKKKRKKPLVVFMSTFSIISDAKTD